MAGHLCRWTNPLTLPKNDLPPTIKNVLSTLIDKTLSLRSDNCPCAIGCVSSMLIDEILPLRDQRKILLLQITQDRCFLHAHTRRRRDNPRQTRILKVVASILVSKCRFHLFLLLLFVIDFTHAAGQFCCFTFAPTEVTIRISIPAHVDWERECAQSFKLHLQRLSFCTYRVRAQQTASSSTTSSDSRSLNELSAHPWLSVDSDGSASMYHIRSPTQEAESPPRWPHHLHK